MKSRLWQWGVVLALLAAACVPDGMRVPQSEFLAAIERKSGLIAYVGVDGNIYTVDQSGSQPTPVTTDAHSDKDYLIYSLPAWSPDSQHVAFAAYSGLQGEAPNQSSLMVARKDGSEMVEAFSSEAYLIYYYWSPDGERLGFLADTPSRNLALKIVSPEGGHAETVDVGSPYYWTWHPDGSSMLVHAGGATASSQERLSLLELDTGIVERGLAIKPSPFKAPAFSPRGGEVLVAGETADGKPALLLTDAAGNAPRPIAEYSGIISFVWSPDGKRVAYITTDDPRLGAEGTLTIVDPSGKQKPVELADEKARAFFWSPDSKSVAYFSTREVPAPTPEPGQTPGEESYTVWNLSIMNAKTGKTHSVATFLPTERFLQVVPYFDQYHQSTTIWSPDSRNLVISAYGGNGRPGIWVVAASGKLEPRMISPGWVAFWSWK